MTDRQFTVAAIALGGVVILGVGYVLTKNAKDEANRTGDNWIGGVGGIIGEIIKAAGSSGSSDDSSSSNDYNTHQEVYG